MKRARAGARTRWLALSGLLLFAGCAARLDLVLPGPVAPHACADAAEVTESVFLIGDAGGLQLPDHPEAELPVDRVLRNLREDVIEQAGVLGVSRVAVIYLGDNVYPSGLAPVGMAGRARGERLLRMQIIAAGPAEVVFVAGEQDWNLVGDVGWQQVRAQQGFLSLQGEHVAMRPAGGCSGPERFDFGRHLRFLFVDPLGLARAVDTPGSEIGVCPHETAEQALLALSAELDRPEGRHVVLALHPPLVSTELAGTVWPGRSAGDVYARMLTAITRATRPRVPLLVAGGHEHNLQLHRDAVGAYYLVSGAGSASQVEDVEPAASALYAEAAPGYARLDAHANGALSLSLIVVRDEKRETALQHCLADGSPS